MKLGVIGARSKHLRFFAQALKESGVWPAADISAVCCLDAPQLEQTLAREYAIFHDPRELIASCDGVIVALREGTQHEALARLCLENKKPVFVDKPFTCDAREAAELVEDFARLGVGCMGGSTLCFLPQVRELAQRPPECPLVTLRYWADPFSPYGGWYFYGSHLTDLCAYLFGGDFRSVRARLEQGCMRAWVAYPKRTVVLETTPQVQPPVLLADRTYILDDTQCYRYGMEAFCRLVAGENPGPKGYLVASVRLMDAIMQSLRLGTPSGSAE